MKLSFFYDLLEKISQLLPSLIFKLRSKFYSMDSKLCDDTMDFSKLCDDIVKIEILSRTSLNTLAAMRCTSKEFEKLTYEPYFQDLYKQRNNIVSGYLLENGARHKNYIHQFAPSRGSNNINFGFLPCQSHILASSEEGIIVFESPHPRTHQLVSYYVGKPATKQILAIPNPKTRFLTQRVAIFVVGSNPLHYKIVRLSSCDGWYRRDGCYRRYRYEIFDSRKWAWKLMDPLIVPSFLAHVHPVTTRGYIYMLLINNEILKFDAYSENWSILSSPIPTLDFSLPDLIIDYERMELMKHEGKLGFTCKQSSGGWEIWVLGIDKSWKKICVLNEEEYCDACKPLNDPDTSVTKTSNTVLFYKGHIVDKVLLTDPSYEVLFYRSDLEATDLTGR